MRYFWLVARLLTVVVALAMFLGHAKIGYGFSTGR
jgi:hypothetical protein